MSEFDTPEVRRQRVNDFRAALEAGHPWDAVDQAYSLDGEWEIAGMQKSAETFRQGVHRVHQMSRLLWEVFVHASQFQHIADVFRLNATGNLMCPFHHELLADESKRERERKLTADTREFQRNYAEGTVRFGSAATWWGDPIAQLGAMVAPWNNSMLRNSLYAFYSSLVILAWAAFEAVAEDAWEAAVNARPSKLATGTVAANDLKRYRFQSKERMGTLLKRADGRSFRSLPDIRQAYANTFRSQGESIKNALSEAGLQYTAAVRNVLIHKSGEIDEEYQEQVKSVPGAYVGTVGERFPLTGVIAAERVESGLEGAAALLKAVRGWVSGHPERS